LGLTWPQQIEPQLAGQLHQDRRNVEPGELLGDLCEAFLMLIAPATKG
jgi:hypothetical protein